MRPGLWLPCTTNTANERPLTNRCSARSSTGGARGGLAVRICNIDMKLMDVLWPTNFPSDKSLFHEPVNCDLIVSVEHANHCHFCPSSRCCCCCRFSLRKWTWKVNGPKVSPHWLFHQIFLGKLKAQLDSISSICCWTLMRFVTRCQTHFHGNQPPTLAPNLMLPLRYDEHVAKLTQNQISYKSKFLRIPQIYENLCTHSAPAVSCSLLSPFCLLLAALLSSFVCWPSLLYLLLCYMQHTHTHRLTHMHAKWLANLYNFWLLLLFCGWTTKIHMIMRLFTILYFFPSILLIFAHFHALTFSFHR